MNNHFGFGPLTMKNKKLSALMLELGDGRNIVWLTQRLDFSLNNLPPRFYKELQTDRLETSLPGLYRDFEILLQKFGDVIQLLLDELGEENITKKVLEFLLKAQSCTISADRGASQNSSISILISRLENQMQEMESLALPFYCQVNRSKEKVKLTRSSINKYPLLRTLLSTYPCSGF